MLGILEDKPVDADRDHVLDGASREDERHQREGGPDVHRELGEEGAAHADAGHEDHLEVEVDELDDTERAGGGFGSTGVKTADKVVVEKAPLVEKEN